MSDRRPENPRLYVKKWLDMEDDYVEYQASSADLIATARRGVESGTIKGEVEFRCVPHSSPWYEDEGLCQRAAAATAWAEDDTMWQDCKQAEPHLVIEPVSDGGSET